MLKRPIMLSKTHRNGINISNNKTTISTNKNISYSNHLLRLSTDNSISSSNSSNTSSLFKTRLYHLSNLKKKNLTLNLQMTCKYYVNKCFYSFNIYSCKSIKNYLQICK